MTRLPIQLSSLTREQEDAVRATEGTVRVVAGAGSGKTRTLVYRYAYLLNDLGIPQSDILCMTFTNKAAHEMKTRIAALCPGLEGAAPARSSAARPMRRRVFFCFRLISGSPGSPVPPWRCI